MHKTINKSKSTWIPYICLLRWIITANCWNFSLESF